MFESPITKLRAERLRRGWSLQQLGVITEVGASDVSRIETRRLVPYPDQARKILPYREKGTQGTAIAGVDSKRP